MDQLPYQEVTGDSYAERAAASFVLDRPEGGLPTLRGPCPRCGDTMSFEVVDDIFKSTRAGRGTQVETLICTCEGEHPGRPADGEGCGAFWNLRLGVGPA